MQIRRGSQCAAHRASSDSRRDVAANSEAAIDEYERVRDIAVQLDVSENRVRQDYGTSGRAAGAERVARRQRGQG